MHLGELLKKTCESCEYDFKTINPFRDVCHKSKCSLMKKYEKKLKPGSKVFFYNEIPPMELIARSKRYAVVVRSLDIEADYDLLYFEVERGAHSTCQEALEFNKDNPIYSLIDFEKNRRGPSNLIFGLYDYWSKEDCEEVIKALEQNEIDISSRHGTHLNIDWKRTLN